MSWESLEGVRKDLRSRNGNFCLVDSLIFHRDKVLGENVKQLVEPYDRRRKVLKLSHESVLGSHMGFCKTKQ